MNPGREYTEEEMRLCPHLRKKFVADSPFKEKITMNSESEATPRKASLDSESDIPPECPYSKSKAAKQPQAMPAPEKTPKAADPAPVEEDEDEEDDQPAGGCPVMTANPKKRNPGYFVPEAVDSQVYVSPFVSVLESPDIFAPKSKDGSRTKNWDSYPIFLKHSLVYMGENYDKYRDLEVGYKFFVTDELREKGNVCFRKGKYAEALSHYEKGVSIMRWLEFTPDEFVQHMKRLPKMNFDPSQFTEDMTVEDIDRIKKEGMAAARAGHEQTPKPVVKDKQYYDDRLNDLMLTSFSDKNVKLVEGPKLKEKADWDIHNNILFQLYSNMSMCYLHMKNLTEAKQAVAEMGKITSNSSIFLIRQAQVILADKASTLPELREAQRGMRRALELKKTEKIFEHNTNFLRIFSLENHETIFDDVLKFANVRVSEKKAQIKQTIHNVLKRAKQIETAEQNIIARGLVPEEGRERTLLLFSQDDKFEEKLLDKITEKYRQAIFFFSASEKPEDAEQVSIAQRCLVKINELRQTVQYLWNFDFETRDRALQAMIGEVNAEFGIVFGTEKIEKRLKRIQREQARELIEKYPFDLQLFEYVIQDIFKEDKEKQQETKKQRKMEEEVNQDMEGVVQSAKGSGYGFAMQLIGMAIFLLLVAYFGKSFLFKTGFKV